MTGTILGSAALTAGQVATTSAASNTVRIRSILPLFAAAEREKFHEDSSGYFRQSGRSINCNLAWRVEKAVSAGSRKGSVKSFGGPFGSIHDEHQPQNQKNDGHTNLARATLAWIHDQIDNTSGARERS